MGSHQTLNFLKREACVYISNPSAYNYIKKKITELRWISVDCVQLANDRVYMMGLVHVSNQPFGYILAGTVSSS